MNPTWDETFFEHCDVDAKRSKDRSTKVGCCIVGPNREIRSTGYNGFPRGVDDDVPERHERPAKYLWTVHSEMNALLNAARMGTPTEGCTLYVQYWPCAGCARSIIQAGIKEVVIRDGVISERWKEESEIAKTMFEEAGILVRLVEKGGRNEEGRERGEEVAAQLGRVCGGR